MRKRLSSAALLGAIAAAVLFPRWSAQAAAKPAVGDAKPALGAVETTRVRFGQGLFLERDLILRGLGAHSQVRFTRPQGWTILPGSTAHIIFNRSADLIPELSTLTLRIGGETKTFQYQSDNGEPREIVISMPPTAPSPYDAIELTADQHYTRECEDPLSEKLWTRISRDSYIDFAHVDRPADADLAVFPRPFFDPTAYSPVRLSIIVPKEPSAATLTALANVLASIAQDVSYRPLQFEFISSLSTRATSHVLAVGLDSEIPGLRELLDGTKLSPLSADDGLVASVALPADPTVGVLVVTGRTPEGLRKAGGAIADRSARALFSGREARVTTYTPPEKAPIRAWPGFVPDRDKFMLRDIGFQSTTVRGVFPEPVDVAVKLEPDAKPVEFRQRLNLHYGFGPGLDPKLSSLELQLNGVSIYRAWLDANGSDSEWMSLELPWDIYGPFNHMSAIFHLYPHEFDACERFVDEPFWGTIYDDSSFDMPKDYWTETHDLSGFARWGFPFTARPDLSEALIVLPDRKDEDAIRAMLRIAVYLGSATRSSTDRLEVAYEDSVSQELLASRHVIALAPKNGGAVWAALGSAAVVLDGKARQELGDAQRGRLDELMKKGAMAMEQVRSPWADQRAVMILRPLFPGKLAEGVAALLTPANLGQLTPNVDTRLPSSVAVVSENGKLEATQIGESRSLIGGIPLARRVRYFFSVYWMFLLALGAGGCYLTFFALRRMLERRKAWVLAREAEMAVRP